MFKHPFSFKGRIGRLEYGITFILVVALKKLDIVMIEYCGDSEFTPLVLAMFYCMITWVFIAQRIKRCRDIGISGWWQFIPLSGILLIYLEGLNRGNNHAENLRQSTYSVFTKIFPLSTISG